MKNTNWHPTNYRKNLIRYWRQYYPQWDIPVGFHVHHIKPKCTFKDNNDPAINHPRNLIAVHIDDHISIHRCRGDNIVNEPFMYAVKGMKRCPMSKETKLKISRTKTGRCRTPFTKEHKKNLANAMIGKVRTEEMKENMSKAHQGQRAWNKGKSPSEETRKKMALAQQRRFAQQLK